MANREIFRRALAKRSDSQVELMFREMTHLAKIAPTGSKEERAHRMAAEECFNETAFRAAAKHGVKDWEAGYTLWESDPDGGPKELPDEGPLDRLD